MVDVFLPSKQSIKNVDELIGMPRRISDEYLGRVCAAVLADERLAAIGRGIPRLLVDQLRAAVLCQQEGGEHKSMEICRKVLSVIYT